MSEAMVVSAQPEATEAGVLVLRQGGNAVDAAVASALVQMVVDPMMCGLAGYGCLQLYLPQQGVHTYIDAYAPAPGAATPDMWADRVVGQARDGYGFFIKGQLNDLGYQSICAPGILKGLFEAQTEFGTWDWADIVAPAIATARAGFVVRPHVNYWWSQGAADQEGRASNPDRLRYTDAGRKLFCDANGNPYGTGVRIPMPDLAHSLELIAAGGADVFYRGEIAQQIAADITGHGGLLSLADLENYATARFEPLWGSYRGLRLATNQPPGGGVVLLEMLNILEEFDLVGLGHNTPDYIRVVAEAMKYATADKDNYVGDPRFTDVPVQRLNDKAYARQLAADIRAGKKGHVERLDATFESKDTTHTLAVDRHGNAVNLTHTLGMPSGVVTDGLGFMYNGCMNMFDPRPGRAGSIAPGKMRYTSMCPSIVFDGDAPRIVIGAPGGTQIPPGLLQVIVNIVDFGMPVLDAICAPRFSATSDAIEVVNRIPAYDTDEVARHGYEIIRNPRSYFFAGVHAVTIAADGHLQGAADPSHDGMALLA